MVYKSFTLLGSEIFTRLHLESTISTFLVLFEFVCLFVCLFVFCFAFCFYFILFIYLYLLQRKKISGDFVRFVFTNKTKTIFGFCSYLVFFLTVKNQNKSEN